MDEIKLRGNRGGQGLEKSERRVLKTAAPGNTKRRRRRRVGGDRSKLGIRHWFKNLTERFRRRALTPAIFCGVNRWTVKEQLRGDEGETLGRKYPVGLIHFSGLANLELKGKTMLRGRTGCLGYQAGIERGKVLVRSQGRRNC